MVNEEAAAVGDETTGGYGATAAPTESSYAGAEEPPEERKALVEKWCKRVKGSRSHKKTETAFKRMRECMKIAAQGTEEDSWIAADNYVAPIINRYVNIAVAALYARNPTALAKRKQKLMFQIWDGDPASLEAAMMAAQPQVDPTTGQPMVDPATGQPVMGDPNAMALLQEVEQAKQLMLMHDRLGKTLQILFQYFLEEQASGYKEQFKALVRRVKVCGVGYVKLGYQRLLKKNPDVEAQIADATSKISRMEALAQSAMEGKIEPGSAEIEELRLLVEDLNKQLMVIAREGPVLSFPKATAIIVDKNCTHLKTFSGAGFVAHEFDMTEEEIEETYKVKLGGKYTQYRDDKMVAGNEEKKDECNARVWEVQDKKNQQVFTICDGYCDFLKEPAEPDVKIERFWNIFPVVFNEVESEDEIYPPSDVWNARHMQREYNTLRQGLREHRKAARPRPMVAAGRIENADKKNFAKQDAFELIEVQSMIAGEDVNQLVGWLKTPGVDPNLYEVETIFADVQRTVGAQEADFGGTSGDTATEASIAEHGRATTNSSDVDDVDTMLTALVKAMGQLMLLELSKETVIEIVGPGAVWPDLPPSREQIAKDLFLEVEAGSSGRPNKAAELANLERGMPFLLQLPNINPTPVGKRYLSLLEIDPDETIVEGLPSMVAMNQMAGRNMQAGANPESDPNQQGDKGRQNTPSTQENEPGGQPAFPAPMPVG